MHRLSQRFFMPEKLPYASLPVLEHAVRSRHRISFHWKGVKRSGEAHKITRARRTGAIIAKTWIDGTGWRDVPYCEIRGLEVSEDQFQPREIPLGKLARIS